MTRQYRKYADIDAVFAANPVTGDVSLRTDEQAVKFSIKNLVLTMNYERPFNSSIGSQIKNYLFEPMDVTTKTLMREVISQTIENHEPRVVLQDVVIYDKPDDHEVVINIMFKIINTEKPLSLTFALERSR